MPLLESDALRAPVAEALGRLGDASVVPALVDALNASSRGVVSDCPGAGDDLTSGWRASLPMPSRIADAVRARTSAPAHEALIRTIPAANRDELACARSRAGLARW